MRTATPRLTWTADTLALAERFERRDVVNPEGRPWTLGEIDSAIQSVMEDHCLTEGLSSMPVMTHRLWDAVIEDILDLLEVDYDVAFEVAP